MVIETTKCCKSLCFEFVFIPLSVEVIVFVGIPLSVEVIEVGVLALCLSLLCRGECGGVWACWYPFKCTGD